MSTEHTPEELPVELVDILRILRNWELIRFDNLEKGWSWVADIGFKNMTFRFVGEDSYISVSTLKNGVMKSIHPPEDQRMEITLEQILLLLQKGVENWNKQDEA